MLLAQDSGNSFDFELCPAGMFAARCYMVCDLGIQTTTWQNEEKHLHKVRIAFELSEKMKNGENEGKPFSVSNTYTLTLSDKANLKKDLESWRGKAFTDEEKKGFDILKLVGVPCLLNVVHNESNGKTYANIASINPLPKEMAAPEPHNAVVSFSLADYTPEQVESLPQWLRDKINFDCPNYEALDKQTKQNQEQFMAEAGKIAIEDNITPIQGNETFDDAIPF